jgi:hypothetical protein
VAAATCRNRQLGGPRSAADLYVVQAKMWFDSIWATVSQDYHRA